MTSKGTLDVKNNYKYLLWVVDPKLNGKITQCISCLLNNYTTNLLHIFTTVIKYPFFGYFKLNNT